MAKGVIGMISHTSALRVGSIISAEVVKKAFWGVKTSYTVIIEGVRVEVDNLKVLTALKDKTDTEVMLLSASHEISMDYVRIEGESEYPKNFWSVVSRLSDHVDSYFSSLVAKEYIEIDFALFDKIKVDYDHDETLDSKYGTIIQNVNVYIDSVKTFNIEFEIDKRVNYFTKEEISDVDYKLAVIDENCPHFIKNEV